MDSRRLPLLMLLAVLLPFPAQASEHKVECSAGISTEKQQAVAMRLACGYRLAGKESLISLRQAAGTSEAPRTETEVNVTSFFLFAEAAEYVAGTDSGRRLDAGMIGLRYLIRGATTIEPFFFGMGGFQNASRTSSMTDDVDSKRFWVAAGGVGADFEIIPPELARKQAIVPVLRLQIEGVLSGAPNADPYVRAIVGVSFRYEGHHQ